MKHALRLIVTLMLLATAVSCAPKLVPIHHYHETERIKVAHDSVTIADTVRIASQGDTIRIEVVKWRTRYRTTTDTLIKRDTVQLPPQLIAQATKTKPSKMILTFAYIGLLATLYALYRLIKRLKVL